MHAASPVAPCVCSSESGVRLSEHGPSTFPELVIEAQDDRRFPTWDVRCAVCGTRWRVHVIPYGGIYGDFDWHRLPPEGGVGGD